MWKKRILGSLIIFIVVMLVLWAPYGDWGFVNEDHAFILWSQIFGFKGFCALFGPQDIGVAFNQPTIPLVTPSFFSALYRPMQFVLFGLETMLVGMEPYRLLGIVIAIHASVSVVLFNIFFFFFEYWLALLGALFFAFHPSLSFWLGVFTCQIYVVDAVYLLMIIFLLKKYLDTNKVPYYLASIVFFFISLFAKETLILIPCWIIFFVCMYDDLLKRNYGAWKKLWHGFVISIGYGCAGIAYLIIRAQLFSMNVGVSSLGFNLTLSSFLARQKERVGDWISYVCDFLYVGIIPSGNRGLKGLLVVCIVLLLVVPFLYDKSKRKVGFFLLMSMFFFSWPAILLYYQPRYLYVALSFFFMLVLTALSFYAYKLGRAKWLLQATLVFCLLINVFAFSCKQKEKEQLFHVLTKSFKSLATKSAVKERAIYFVGLPALWFGAGNVQAVWFHNSATKKFPILYQLGYFAFKRESFYELKMHDVSVTRLDESHVRIISYDGEGLWFPGCSAPHIKSTVIVHATNSAGYASDFTIILSDDIVALNPVFVTWDYKNQTFKFV